MARGIDPQLILKTAPPRTSDWLLPRERLALDRLGIQDKQAILVQAPPGFGKTSLLMQWRRACLAAGSVVVWLTIDERDHPLRMAHAIGGALHTASGGRSAGPKFINWLGRCEDGIEALTGLLVEISEQTYSAVIIIDNFERTHNEAMRDALAYLIRNAPANLQIIVGARPGMLFDLPEFIDQNIVARVSAADLAFQYEETLALVARHFDRKLDTEAAGRLHELTEGWPLGLQLVIATLKKSHDLNAATQAISASTGDIQRYFVEHLIARLPPDMSDFLMRLSVFDQINPELCAAVFPALDTEGLLARLLQETPVFLRAEDSPWIRMHGLARDFLLTRYKQLPSEERARISMRCCAWLSDHEFYEEAARHALLAKNDDVAYELAERMLYRLGASGRVTQVVEWLDRLPPSELQRRPALWITAAWSLALCNRHKEAERIVGYILADPASDEEQRFEATLVTAVAASFDDDLERYVGLMEPCTAQLPRRVNQEAMRAYNNSMGLLNLYRWDPAKARHIWTQVAQAEATDPTNYSRGFAEFQIGFSHLWEGQFHLAEKSLRASLVRFEQDQGRRGAVPCMIAAVLAATLWEMGGVEEPRAILSYRMDVIERAGLPETIMLAYLTQARIALHMGQEAHAHEQLNALIALGEARNMPRLQIAGIGEQIRMHANLNRRDTVASLCQRLETFCAGLDLAARPVTAPWIRLHLNRALAYGAIATRDWDRALQYLDPAAECAATMRLARDSIEIRLLRGLALERSTKFDAASFFEESLSLAKAGGMVRTLLDTHPEVLSLLKKVTQSADFRVDDLQHAVEASAKPVKTKPGEPAKQSGGAYANSLLTAKEREILGLIAGNMSNKQIAIALDISEETVKWHAKNLFSKLSAGNRSHAVKRAYILGILETASV